jgi:hypothetical protein
MKVKVNKWSNIGLILVLLSFTGYHCSTSRRSADKETIEVINTNADGNGMNISVVFSKGESHNHPLMAIWLEDPQGNYIETLYVAESIGKGIFQRADRSKGLWQSGPVRRPAALPYWGHKRGIQAADGYYLPTPDNPMPDAITGPTPAGNFRLNSKTSDKLPPTFIILMEINQPWDWNEYWTNDKFPDDEQYKTSSQPSVVYAVEINPGTGNSQFNLIPIGHGHHSGENGKLYEDLSSLTTALTIVKSAVVTIQQKQ